MEKRYVGRNVDLYLLSRWIEHFFKKKNFRTVKERDKKGYRVVAGPTHVHEVVDKIIISISGDPSDFTLRFSAGARSNFFTRFGFLTALLGGGIWFLRGMRSQEAEEKLERTFWIYVEEKVNFLVNST